MGRKLYSPTRTISNRGDRPRYIGNFPCTKTELTSLPFDSLSAMLCGIWLEWRKDVVSIAFEPRAYKFPAIGELPDIDAIPDYEVVFDSGELAPVEAKYSAASLSNQQRAKLNDLKAHFARTGVNYEVVYRDNLEASGFIDTVLLLRPYAQLYYSQQTLARATTRLHSKEEPATLWTWRERARKAKVPTGLLYYLLYRQALPLRYEPLMIWELSACRD